MIAHIDLHRYKVQFDKCMMLSGRKLYSFDLPCDRKSSQSTSKNWSSVLQFMAQNRTINETNAVRQPVDVAILHNRTQQAIC